MEEITWQPGQSKVEIRTMRDDVVTWTISVIPSGNDEQSILDARDIVTTMHEYFCTLYNRPELVPTP
jgi:hypothetical protein